jgi:hypothetical protein
MRKWRILEYGDLDPEKSRTIDFNCRSCGKDAELSVSGLAIAQVDSCLIFDTAKNAVPRLIECPHCRKRMEAA